MPYDFDGPRLSALVLIFVMWVLYGPILNWLGPRHTECTVACGALALDADVVGLAPRKPRV